MRIVSVIGARPQFIKAAPVSLALRRAGHEEILVHTGQHYDPNMSELFFEELDIPRPDVNLSAGSGLHGAQTGAMLAKLEEVLVREKPERVVVYGDTNSTLAAALAAAKLNIAVAHVEAGLRSFKRTMPEEVNRVVADHLSNILLCPSQTAVENLKAEGITEGVYLVGDVMYDAVLQFAERAKERSRVLRTLELEPKGYLLGTVHRPENTDNPARLENILAAFSDIQEPLVFPVHPRTRKIIAEQQAQGRFSLAANVKVIEAVGYLDMFMLERHARMILTDSGGIQKEAYWLGVPCVTLRDETEWVETVEAGWNTLVGADRARILEAVEGFHPVEESRRELYGDGHVAEQCIRVLESHA